MMKFRAWHLLLVVLAGCGSPAAAPEFSHHKHVLENGIACLYCHPHPEKSASAGLPSVKKCMDCHSFLHVRTPALQPLFDAWETQQPLRWRKHNDMPDHLVFSHQVHLRAGVFCNDCHGDVENDRLNPPLTMRQCTSCHQQREAARNCSACHK